MADIFTTPEACLFFVEADPYNFITDNRPLTQLLNNDLLLNAELEATRDEVLAARDSAIKATIYGSLDARLEDIEDSIGDSLSITDIEAVRSHTWGRGQIAAAYARAACPSGFLDYGGIADLAVGGAYDDFAGWRTTASLGTPGDFPDTIVLWCGWGLAHAQPVRVLVNGFLVELFNEAVNSPTTALQDHVTINLGVAPTTDERVDFAFLEVWFEKVTSFYKYGAPDTLEMTPTTIDPLHPDVVRTVVGMDDDGEWIQLRHRIRVHADVDPDEAPEGFTSGVFARGAAANPVANYLFQHFYQENGDAGLWRAGLGDAQSMSDLGSYDGYVWAVPLVLNHRRNSGSYGLSNQNGTRDAADPGNTGFLSSGMSGRPDGLYYDAVDQRDLLDLRHQVSLSGFDASEELRRTFEMLIRGELRTWWRQLRYDHNNDGTWDNTGVWGHTLAPIDQIANAAEANTHPVRNRRVSGEPLAVPDGQRNQWSRADTPQVVVFGFTEGNAGSAFPAGFVTYNAVNQTVTLNCSTLDGAGAGGTKVGITPPQLFEKPNLQEVRRVPSLDPNSRSMRVTGLGTTAATLTMSGLTASAQYVGYAWVTYPGGAGLAQPHRRVLHHEVLESGTELFDSLVFGVSGSPGADNAHLRQPRGVAKDAAGNYYLVDALNHRVVKLDPDLAYVAQFGVTGTAGADNTHLSSPTGVVVAGSPARLFVVDTGNHRVVRFDPATMGYLSQFGITGVSGADDTHCNGPTWIAASTDGSVLYAADTGNHRVLRLSTSLTKTGQFGATGTPGSSTVRLNRPTGIAYTGVQFAGELAQLWVADSVNRRIVVLNSDLTFEYQIGDRVNLNTLAVPYITDVIQDSAGNFYLSSNGQHVVWKYSPDLALLAQFGVANSPGSNNSRLRWPSGLALDEAGGYLYVADSHNHRVVRLAMSNLAYVGQYGVTGVTGPGGQHCPYPADVDLDDAKNFYISHNEVHRVTKVSSNFSTRLATFGVYGSAAPSSSSTTQLRNPLGIAVKGDGSRVAVVDAGNVRVVMLNGSLAYQAHFVPKNDLAAVPKNIGQIFDVTWDPAQPSAGWYVSVKEHPPSTPHTVSWSWAIMRFADAPGGVGPNFAERFVSYDGPVGLAVTATQVLAGTGQHGLILHTKASPATYEFTSDPRTSIYYKFYDLTGGLSSDGTSVLVVEPVLHCVHQFRADSGIRVSAAGVMWEAGDDDGHLRQPRFALLDSDNGLLVADSNNHRLLLRHRSAPWVATSGAISVLRAPSGADKIRVFSEADVYQGILERIGGLEAVYKSQVLAESDSLHASTLGQGATVSWALSQSHQTLLGMTTRLPLPWSWKDWDVRLEGMATLAHHTSDSAQVILNETPYLVLPVIDAEGYLGGSVETVQEGSSSLSSRQALQQVIRTVGVQAADPGRFRGFRSVLPEEKVVRRTTRFVSRITRFPVSLADPGQKKRPQDELVENYSEVIRRGVPRASSMPLARPVPHFVYFPFLYLRQGALVLGVVAQGHLSDAVAVGTDPRAATSVFDYQSNSFDGFFTYGRRLLKRGS